METEGTPSSMEYESGIAEYCSLGVVELARNTNLRADNATPRPETNEQMSYRFMRKNPLPCEVFSQRATPCRLMRFASGD